MKEIEQLIKKAKIEGRGDYYLPHDITYVFTLSELHELLEFAVKKQRESDLTRYNGMGYLGIDALLITDKLKQP